MSLTFALVCGGHVLAKSELELLRERRAELDRKIQQLEQQEKRTPESAIPSTPAASSSKEEGRFYLVRKGDTLERISRKTRVSVATLEELNQLKASTVIHIGQKLKLPAPAVTESRPKETKSKETSVAVKTEPAPSSTKTISNPAKSAAPANSPRSKTTSTSETKASTTKLEAGNEKLVIHSITLQSPAVYSDVAEKYSTTTDRLNDLNGLSLNHRQLLKEGTELYVPMPAQP